MNICIIGDKNIYIKRFCNYLVGQGNKVYLICRHKNGLPEYEFSDEIVFYYLHESSLFYKYFRIKKILKKIKPDTVHLHYATRDSIIPALILNRKYKYIISIWGSDLNVFSKNVLNRLIQNIAFILADNIHLLSDYILKKFTQKYKMVKKQKLKVLPWGIQLNKLSRLTNVNRYKINKEYNLSDNDFIILSYRNHKPLYNHHTIIKAMPLVLKKYKNVKFIFTKGSSEKKYIKESLYLVNRLEIIDNFIFIDKWLEDSELFALINMASISITIPFMDGLPATLYEIMYSNAIPITSNLENYHFFFKNGVNGFFLNNLLSETELAELILDILDNFRFYRKKIVPYNKKYIKNNQNFDVNVKKIIQLYSI